MKTSQSRDQLAQNILKGKIAEEIARSDYKNNGFQIVKTGIGSDFKVFKNNNSLLYEHVEVKQGNSRLTKRQKKTKNNLKQKGIPYSIYRVSNKFLDNYRSERPELSKLLFTFDLSQFTGIFAITDPTTCPHCNLCSVGLDSILVNFGLRNMGNGTVRVQSWCRNCRDNSRRSK
jgi:hypothetical protein